MNTNTSTKPPLLSDRVYNGLKYVAQILLPAVGALYFGLAQIWGLPNAEQVVGTITTIDVFLGTVLFLSTKQYDKSDAKYDGALELNEANDLYRFVADRSLDELAQKDSLTIKVAKPS